jgi:Na+/H+ antiporter NhaD/arsenite permease-like protein
MSPAAVTLTILALAIVAFVSNRVPLGIVAIGVSVALWFTGVLDLGQALSGFGDPTVVFIACLFVVSEALDSTGVTAWVGQQVIERGGRRRTPLIVTVCILVALLTALISVNGAVAALIPVVVVVATRVGLPPSQMLMPLAFSAHAGSQLALTGTPVNIIVSEAAADAGARPFAFFEFGLVGLPLLTGTLLIVALLGRRLLPERAPSMLPQDVTEHARALGEQYALPEGTELISARRGVTEVVVSPRSELIGMHLFPGMVTPSGDLVILASNVEARTS